MEWRNVYRGFLIGATDLIPGVSGSTIAILLGIYERLLEAISGLFSRAWRKQVRWLLPLGLGMGTALLLLSRAIDYLLERHFMPTQFFFLGLIIGVLPNLLRQFDAKREFHPRHYALLAAAAAAVVSMAFVDADRSVETLTALTVPAAFGLFFSGWLAAMAMLLPGVSGSFVLLVMGVYPTAIHALSTVDIPLIAVIGSGVGVGFVVSSKGIRYLLTHRRQATHAFIIGLIVGSVFVVFPGFPGGTAAIASAAAFVAGLSLTLALGARTLP